jgi:hypothetical protein
MGTTKEWHMRRAKNPFVIIRVFYPKKKLKLLCSVEKGLD